MEQPATTTFEDIARMDAEFQTAAKKEPIDPIAEAKALKMLISDTKIVELCIKTVGEKARISSQTWASWNDKSDADVGSAAVKIVNMLDAPHLKPTGILERINNGVAPACYGLVSLMEKLEKNN